MSDQRWFKGAGGIEFWAIPNDPVCSECLRFGLPCVNRVGSFGTSCYQCSQRRHACPFASKKKCPRSLQGTGFADQVSRNAERTTPSRSAVQETPVIHRQTRLPARRSTSELSPRLPDPAALSASDQATAIHIGTVRDAALARIRRQRSTPQYSPSRSPSRARSSSVATLDLDFLSLDAPEPLEVLDITLPGPARAVSVASSLDVFSRTPSPCPSRDSRALSQLSELSMLSRTPSPPRGSMPPPSPRTDRRQRGSRLRESTVFEESSTGEIIVAAAEPSSSSEFVPPSTNPFDESF